MFKHIRVAILLFILATVAMSAWQSKRKATSWKGTLQVAVFPINGDGSPASAKFIAGLDDTSLESVADYLAEEGRRYGLSTLQPVRVSLGPEIRVKPPEQAGHSMLEALKWSLSMRYWAWKSTPKVAITPDIRLYALYFDPAQRSAVPHSVGLEKGQLGVANLFATRQMQGSNLVVLTHELLHTLGATDKYGLADGLPLYPTGYAEPDKTPRFPQRWAEIMGGRTPITATRADIPESLSQTLIGPETAGEIGWGKFAKH